MAAASGTRSDSTLAIERERVALLHAELATMNAKLETVTASEQKAVRELAVTIREHARQAAELELTSARNELEQSRDAGRMVAPPEEKLANEELHKELRHLRSDNQRLQQQLYEREQSTDTAQTAATAAKRQLAATKQAAIEVSTLSASVEMELQHALNESRADANRARTEA